MLALNRHQPSVQRAMVLYPLVYSRQELHLNAYVSIIQGLCIQVIIPALFHATTRPEIQLTTGMTLPFLYISHKLNMTPNPRRIRCLNNV